MEETRDWQDISTAPKERTYETWLLSDGHTVTTGHWCSLGWGGLDWNRVLPGWQPTHWQPLPTPTNTTT